MISFMSKLQPIPDIINIAQKQGMFEVDKGEVISRNSFKKFFAPPESEIKMKKGSSYHSIDRVTNKKTLMEFLDKEEKFRYEQGEKSLTNQSSFMQWQAFKTACLKLGDSLGDSSVV